MRNAPCAPETAKLIVNIQRLLMLPLSTDRREKLTTKQRTLWEATFPMCSYDQIVATLH